MSVTRYNWAENTHCHPKKLHFPRTEAEVVALVRRCRDNGERLKVIGAGHSWTDVAMTDGHMVSLDRMASLVTVDRDAMQVTVQAGLRLYGLIDMLNTYGLANEMLGSVKEQSVAGVIATGTHGTGLKTKNIASQVKGMRLVTGTGEVLVLDESTKGDLLNAARVALGTLGIITEVTLQAVPAFNLEERSWALPFDKAVAQMPVIINNEEHVKYWWMPHTGKIQIIAYNRTAKPVTPVKPWTEKLDAWVNEVAFQKVLSITARHDRLIPTLNRLIGLGYFSEGTRVAPSDKCFNLAMPAKHVELEYAVPVEDAPELLARTQRAIKQQNLRVNFVQELRFAAGDDAWLSPAYGRDTCHFGAYMGETPQTAAYFRTAESMALEYDGRPHWGKLFYADGERVLKGYAMADKFRKLRAKHDPDGVFGNAFTDRLFA